MRKYLLPIAAAASTMALAAPASAQWYPQPQPRPYGYANTYGHQNFGPARALHARINGVQREIARLAQYRMISPREYRSLRSQSRSIEQRLARASRYGLNPREAYSIQRRISRLEYRVAMEVRDGRRWAYRR